MEYSWSTGVRAAGWCGVVAHGLMFFWYAASGLLAPLWGVGLMLALWAGLGALALWLLRHHPLATPLVPLAALAVWVLAVSAGESWLGWTA